ncbi:hypothetical protein TURBIDO_67 [Mycobacterium phage Turbido]|uniref:Uncharacterized protein n=8 Tax=Turbidovirus TaxID=2948936 RepID=A0A143FRL4_9CAUD|nr:hypothetical protein TURBIDO_67 [Mycobacterium phage Turbido]YP_009304001.1 hypothetical protein SEA_EVILGENIUS_67 [Mycobacterium phage EvilGenius]YP_010063599.1 hypothetical protein KIY81_gp26 [Mycobacterium phage Bugsy]AMW64324.1 hypothetical protein SEA_CHIPMUNK_68 [Mycobacterium phage ChipMunk]AWH13584.1 hypothetical protein SEA_ABBYPAIGE_68 [Mycobacterium phage AbbyPaige]AYD86616.1 hypothetical protein SEA_LILTURB_67 [Mycobacterium phage LilTurb]QBI96569.1 hypothetical protein SEA_WHA
MATPNAMPKKANVIHQQILSGLLATKPATWARKTLVKGADGKESVVKTTVTHLEPRFPLARNVSDFNIDRTARRWL